jgi:hypothetical protein
MRSCAKLILTIDHYTKGLTLPCLSFSVVFMVVISRSLSLHIHTFNGGLLITESTIILAIIGMLGLFTSALVYQRSNRITKRYYSNK